MNIVEIYKKMITQTKRKRILGLGVLVLVVSFGSALFAEPLLIQTGGFFVYESTLVPSDVIVVLAGSLFDRTEKAIELYQQGYSDKILFTQPEHLPEEHPLADPIKNEQSINRALLDYYQIPVEKVLHGNRVVLSTYEEAVSVREQMESRSLKSAIVVSGYFHSRRAHEIFDSVFQNTGISIIIAPAEEEGHTITDWWKSEKGFLLVQNEALKSAFRLFSN